jgi:hypothetical protein
MSYKKENGITITNNIDMKHKIKRIVMLRLKIKEGGWGVGK